MLLQMEEEFSDSCFNTYEEDPNCACEVLFFNCFDVKYSRDLMKFPYDLDMADRKSVV